MFRKILPATILVACVTAPVLSHAADWSGLYVGANAGYGFGKFSYNEKESYADTGPGFPLTGVITTAGHQPSSGFLGGGTLGYNFFCPDNFFLGAETDFDWSGVKSGYGLPDGIPLPPSPILPRPPGSLPIIVRTTIQYLSTARARIGYSPIENFYIYGTGGAVLGDLKPNLTANIPSLSPFGGTPFLSQTSRELVWHFGWTAGGGIGYRISDKLSINTEYLYTDLGKTNLLNRHVVSDIPFAHYTADFKVTAITTANIVRVSVDYSLN